MFVFSKQKETMIKNKTEMYENKIKRLKAYYSEEIKERDEKLAVSYFGSYFLIHPFNKYIINFSFNQIPILQIIMKTIRIKAKWKIMNLELENLRFKKKNYLRK